MASPITTQYIRANLHVIGYDHDPGGTSATLVSPDGGTTVRAWDMRDYSHFGVQAITTVLGGSGITKVEIVASDSSDMSTNVTVIKDSGTVAADALADQVVEECTAQEVAQEGSDAGVDLRYVAGRITCDNSGDEAIVNYIGIPNNPNLDLTPATTIA